ncbi:MAG TPA: hydrogenase maturation nickel metallochaperone HypA, partial [Candidatus Bilophila faecipullorum]|nr:hydrogenase maturation nickel metallochaperone HypA [Candidatus Bilophila faecipullorum]
IPITLKCSQCGHIFSPPKGEHFFAPCPSCGEEFGHGMETGRELYVQHIEAE